MILRHAIGQSIEVQHPSQEAPLWRYVYGGKPKPFFHPLHTPAGFCVSLFEPHDHVWHRGLWFTIKFVNGENFWEENNSFGMQRSILPPTITHGEDHSIAWTHEQRWERPNNAGGVFAEKRGITYRPLNKEAYALDWEIELTAQSDVVLERTPFTTWGGYGGLILRGNRNWQNTRILFPDHSTSDRPTGIPAQWSDLSGTFDGGLRREGGVALFDHPANVRHPSPWYGATGAGHYLNAAFLFHEAMHLNSHETLRLRYRTLVHDNLWDVSRLQTAYDDYAQEAIRE